MAKQVAIIGAGCTGLAAIKTCLDEGLDPVCFESSSEIGGLWRFTDDVSDGRGCVMSSTVINTSKEMMSYSDFPPPADYPNFMPHTKVLEYFHLYAERFNLLKHIRFQTEVLHVGECRNSNSVKNKEPISSLWKTSKWKTTIEEKECNSNEPMMSKNNSSAYNNNNNNNNKCNRPEKEKNGRPTVCDKTRLSYKTTQDLNHSAQFSEQVSQGHWEVKVRDKDSGICSVQNFDFVLICTGHHADINMPYFPGQSLFKGKILHSRDLRRPSEVAGSRHLVVGVGNSGCDVAVEMSRRGKTFLSTRRGTWLMHRLQSRGLPADISYMNRVVFTTMLSLPMWIPNRLAEWDINAKVDHTLYGLHPKHGPFSTHPTVNDELPNRIAAGHVVVKSNIDSFTASGVKFDDGTEEDDIDTVIMATGYKIGFPFLDQSTLQVEGNHTHLYLYMFPPTVTPPTLSVIGCIQPGGAIIPVSEMQCRLAVRAFMGKAKLPTQQEMKKDIEKRRQLMEKRYIHTQRHTIQVDYIPYMDELASIIGCKPGWGSLFLTDPRLALKCIFGPCTPYQYRLQGPGQWLGAREAIMTQMDRVKRPFLTRNIPNQIIKAQKEQASHFYNAVLILLFVFTLCVFWAFCI